MAADESAAAMLAQDEAMSARRELAKKQRERAMAQMQSMQRKFLEKNKEHMLDHEAVEVEEVYVCVCVCACVHVCLSKSVSTVYTY